MLWHFEGGKPLEACLSCANRFAMDGDRVTPLAQLPPTEEPPPKTPQEKQLRVLIAMTQAHALLGDVLEREMRVESKDPTVMTDQIIIVTRLRAVLGKVTNALRHFPEMPQSTAYERIMRGETDPDGDEG